MVVFEHDAGLLRELRFVLDVAVVKQARVRRVDPAGFTKVSALGIEEQRVRAILDFEGDAAARAGLGHQFRVMAHISLERIEGALLVPLGALFRRGERWAVFTLEVDSTVRERFVQLGARTNREAAVVEGLAEGARIVLHPSDRLKDGVRIVERRAN